MKRIAGRVALVLIILGVMAFMANAKAKTQAELIGCKAFMEKIGQGLTGYAKENQGRYPATLAELEPKYVEKMPTCLAADKPYGYQVTDNGFRVSCVGPHRGLPSGHPFVEFPTGDATPVAK